MMLHASVAASASAEAASQHEGLEEIRLIAIFWSSA
jgi:hypothetical protein